MSLWVGCAGDPPSTEDGGLDSGVSRMDMGADATPTADGQSPLDGASVPDGAVTGIDSSTGVDGRVLDGQTADSSTSGDGATAGDGGGAGCVPIACGGGGGVAACADCVDNDRDGLTDSRDPECLGACDNTEGPVLLTGVAGEPGGRCTADCYFDVGNGSGGEDCRWDHRCDPLSIAPSYPPEGDARCAYDSGRVGGMTCPATQPAQCLNRCRPITPNGCDCFGCCTFPTIRGRAPSAGGEFVWLGSRDSEGEGSCTLASVGDTARCHPCTPVMNCFNDCGPCEVCIGRPTPPPECNPPPPVGDAGASSADGGTGASADSGASDAAATDAGTPPQQCPFSWQPCGLPGQASCDLASYCTTGCCVPVPIF